MIFAIEMKDLTTLQILSKNVGSLGKIIVATGFELYWSPDLKIRHENIYFYFHLAAASAAYLTTRFRPNELKPPP